MAFPIKSSIATNNLAFNPNKPVVMHVDINSCFASVEQQANPLLRNKPIAVIARDTPHGCVLAASVEAKRYGIKTGFRAFEAKALYKDLIFVTPDPDKYRAIHEKMHQVLLRYTPKIEPKSIDEFVLHLSESPKNIQQRPVEQIAQSIKSEIKTTVGDWIRVSVGIGPNRFLAKTAAGIKKPDGLIIIDINNFYEVYSKLKLTDLNGINVRNENRLNSCGIFTVNSFYNAKLPTLRQAFESVLAEYWHIRLRGWEMDDFKTKRRTIGHSYVLPKPLLSHEQIAPIIHDLTQRIGHRLRHHHLQASGIHVGILFEKNKQKHYWHRSKSLSHNIFDSTDIYKESVKLIRLSEQYEKFPARKIQITCFDLKIIDELQLDIFQSVPKKIAFCNSVDLINDTWGNLTIMPAKMIGDHDLSRDAVSFGQITKL